jgi:hypothetical protein
MAVIMEAPGTQTLGMEFIRAEHGPAAVMRVFTEAQVSQMLAADLARADQWLAALVSEGEVLTLPEAVAARWEAADVEAAADVAANA